MGPTIGSRMPSPRRLGNPKDTGVRYARSFPTKGNPMQVETWLELAADVVQFTEGLIVIVLILLVLRFVFGDSSE